MVNYTKSGITGLVGFGIFLLIGMFLAVFNWPTGILSGMLQMVLAFLGLAMFLRLVYSDITNVEWVLSLTVTVILYKIVVFVSSSGSLGDLIYSFGINTIVNLSVGAALFAAVLLVTNRWLGLDDKTALW